MFIDRSNFSKKLEGPVYDENSGVTRFILCKLAEKGMTGETFIDLWSRSRNRFDWTVEHIFPQGEKISQDWVDMIAEGDIQRANDIRQTHVHKLGNLTITMYNSNLYNMSFERKRG